MKTKEEIAEFFGVDPLTIDRWAVKYEEFSNAYDEGGEKLDQEVIVALGQRAKGYSHKAEKILLGPGGTVIREEYIEHYPPDTAAAGLWLSNRQRGKWSLKAWSNKEEDAEVPQIKIVGGLPDE